MYYFVNEFNSIKMYKTIMLFIKEIILFDDELLHLKHDHFVNSTIKLNVYKA